MLTSVIKKEARFANIRFLIALSFSSGALFFGMTTTSLAATPVIFHATESAGPGNVVQLQGADFGASLSVSIQLVTGSEGSLAPSQPITVLSQSDTSVAAQIPSTFPNGLYALWVSNGVLSQPVMINRARINQIEFPEVNPGRTFRLFGRNLFMNGFTPAVRFVDQADPTKIFAGSVLGGDGYAYRVKASSKLVVGRTYAIYFKNGAGGNSGEAAAADSLPVRSGGADYYSLGVPWGADFASFSSNVYNVKTDGRLLIRAKGDGIADDKAAIQGAIDAASAAGGGVVYFPNGAYNIVTFTQGIGLTMKSKVVLRGESRAGTTLKFSPASDPVTDPVLTYRKAMIWWDDGVAVSGLFKLTVRNNTSFRLDVGSIFGANTTKVFFKHVTIDLNKWGESLTFEGSRYLIDNVTVSNPSVQGNTLLLSQPGSTLRTSHYAIIRNSTFPNITRRLTGGVNTIIENNTFTYDGSYQALVESLQPQPDFWHGEQNSIEIRDKTVMLNNTFNHVGKDFLARNDGETILNQAIPTNDANQNQYDLGTATSAMARTLSDASKNWGTLNWTGFIVAITDGPGAGQWRKIDSSTQNSVTVDRDWQVIPTNASRYALTKFGIQTVLIKGNVLQNKERGIWLYTGGQDVAIVNNTLTDAAGIWIRSVDKEYPWFPPVDKEYPSLVQVAWDVLVANNRVTRTGPTRPAYIVASAYHRTPDVAANGVLAVELRGNAISVPAPPPGSAPLPELGYPGYSLLRDGYTAAASYLMDSKFGSPDWSKASLRGVVFDSNSAINVEMAYHLSSGAYQTQIANSIESGVSQRLQDMGTYDGQLLNGAGWTAGDAALGYGNQALMLDGVDDRVSLGLVLAPSVWGSHLSILSKGPAFTLEARVKTTASGVRSILDFANGPTPEPQWGLANGLPWMRAAPSEYLDNRTINDGQWHHVAVSYDGTTLSFYIDGMLGNSHVVSLAPFTFNPVIFASAGAWLGSSWHVDTSGNVTWPFSGALDEVRIWKVARSATEILTNAHRELAGSETGLTHYWRFNEGTGNLANDAVFADSVDTVLVTP